MNNKMLLLCLIFGFNAIAMEQEQNNVSREEWVKRCKQYEEEYEERFARQRNYYIQLGQSLVAEKSLQVQQDQHAAAQDPEIMGQAGQGDFDIQAEGAGNQEQEAQPRSQQRKVCVII